MKSADRVFLIGPMGAGKTTIGRHLAQSLKLEFIDSDHEIERRTGADIPWIFDIEGEAGFRQREHAVIEDLTRRAGLVLATGGGVVLDPRNRAALAERGTVVYLQASVAQILARTAKSQNRPLLRTDDPKGRIEGLLAERDPLYREIADIIVDTSKRNVRATINELLARLRPAAKKRRAEPPAKKKTSGREAPKRRRAARAGKGLEQ